MDRACVLSTWFGDICCSRRDLYILQKVTITLFQILFVAAATPRPMQYCVPTEMHWQYWPSPLRGGNELLLLISAVRVCRLPSLFSIMFLDTLYSKKWYDMPHIGCGIHSLQRSTICRIDRHSAGYNIGMHVVLYKL